MSDYDRNAAATKWGRPITRAETTVIDAGLRAYMLRVYNYMVIGLAITGFAALGVYLLSVTGDPALAMKSASGTAIRVAGNQYLTAPLGMVFFLGARMQSMSSTGAQVMFWVFSALIGVSLGSIFLVYTHTSIVRVFFITAASFGALSLYGYTTQRSLSGMASFLIMGLVGVIIASLVNLFLQSSMLQFIVSVVGVLVFAGLTAWDTQRLKEEYLHGAMEGEALEKSAIMGALSLYLNFINMFTLLLQLFGQRDQ
jgi:FtsH-binding integral membrane protein